MVLSVGSVILLLGYIYWATAGYMDRQTDATIEAEIRGLAEQYRRRDLAGLSSVIAERVARDPAGASLYLLADEALRPLVGNLSRWPQGATMPDGWVTFLLEDWGHDKSEEHEARARVFLLRGDLHLLVGRDVRDLEGTRRLIVNALGWGLAITLALALGGGFMVSTRAMRRIEAINQTSREIMDGDLSRRVPTDGSGDDLDQLAGNLNSMLERIEQLMTAVREVSDNIAHDLRTPLTRLRTKLELAQTRGGEPQELHDLVLQAAADADELLTTFNALLRIARIESGSRRSAFATIDLSRLVQDVAEFYEPLAADKGQYLRVRAQEGLTVRGDRDLLFQAVANLVDNAVKYTPSGGHVRVSAEGRAGYPEVMVADTGPGIPAELREKVFQRFFRLDDSRSAPGSGLGLSLVRAVSQLHGASVGLEDNEPGVRALLRFRIAE
jgi:signal transduction histidine kinase